MNYYNNIIYKDIYDNRDDSNDNNININDNNNGNNYIINW